ncbi:MAG: GTP-binding protein Era [Thermoleophilia bacterium]|nr:GTP-binding protein Era [Thermoleophilia bacterium]
MSAIDVTHSGFIAVAGRPNAGKSTLVNRIVGRHVAIVSRVAQTTRRIVRASITVGTAQLVFVDLPGSQKPMDRMTSRMQRSVEASFSDVDFVLWVIDGSVAPGAGEERVADLVFGARLPVIVALNKVDLAKPAVIMQRIIELQALIGDREYAELVPISALTGDGVDVLLEQLIKHLPEGPAWFGDDDVVDMREDERIAEYVREATLAHLRDELPHATAVTVDDLVDEADLLRAECTIWVERESQIGIVVGKGGATIRDVGIAARERIDRELGTKVHLELRVKVRKHWRDDEQWLSRAGL